MKKVVGMVLTLGMLSASHGAITVSVVGDGTGYDEANMRGFRSTSIPKLFDVDGNNEYGSEGTFFFGNNGVDSGNGMAFTVHTQTGASWATFAQGSAPSSGTSSSTALGPYDNPTLSGPDVDDWTFGGFRSARIASGSAGVGWAEFLTFTIDSTAPERFRIGLMSHVQGGADARWDPEGLRIVVDGSTNSVTGLPSTPNNNDPSWVFFDVDLNGETNGTFSIQGIGHDIGSNSRGSSLSGVTFDKVNDAARLEFFPGELSLELVAPDTSVAGTITASYISGAASSNDIEILSLTADAGFSAAAVPDLGTGNPTEDITVTYDNSGNGLQNGETTNSTLEIVWTELSSGVNNTSSIPVDVMYINVPTHFVNADVAMPTVWNLYAPLPGNALTNESSSGFTATFAENTYTNDRSGYIPVVAQEFAAVQDLSQLGQSITVAFDIEMLNTPLQHDKDFHFGFYDTGLNSQIWTGFDLGTPSGSQWVMRMLDWISATDTNDFIAGDYGWFGTAYQSFGSGSSYSGTGLTINNVMHFETTLARTGADEVTYTTAVWDYSGGTTGSCTQVINELAPPSDSMPPSGKWDSVDGFGFTVFENLAFQGGSGSFAVSNFTVTVSVPLAQNFGYSISGYSTDLSGNMTLNLSEPIPGATYRVLATDNLVLNPMQEVGLYVADSSGSITIPAADIAPYIGDTGFIDVELPVTVIGD